MPPPIIAEEYAVLRVSDIIVRGILPMPVTAPVGTKGVLVV